MTKKLLKAAMLSILCLLLLASTSPAQTIVTGGFSGTITDPTGAVVPGVSLTLTSSNTGDVFTTVSSATGGYTFSLLKPGDYVLTAKKDSFETSTQKVTVLLGQSSTVSFSMELGSSSTTIEVTGEGNQLQTENANIATTFDTHLVQNIPNPGNDITYTAQLAPGVTMNASTGGGYGNFSTFGLPATSNLFTMNGNDYNDPFLNLNNTGSSNLLLGNNDVQEVSVVNNGYTGQYGRQAGSQVDVSTRSGANAFHGNAIYDWTGRYLNANDPFNKATSPVGGPINPRPFENNNQWAASLGGPIKKDKAFFFLDTEGIRYIFGSVHAASAPTPAFEDYVLGNVPQDSATQAFYQNIFKLYSGAPNIANAVPTPGSCTANGLPASIGGDMCTEAWTDSVPAGNKEWLLIGRVDYSFSDRDKIFGRVKFDRGTQPTYTDTLNPIFNTNSVQPQDEGQLNYTHVFSPTVVNNFVGSVLWYSALFGSINSNSPALGLFPGNLAFSDGSLTNVGFGSGNPGGYGQGFLFPQGRNVTQWGLVDDLSITRGNHSFKMGANFRRDDISDHAASSVALYPAVNTTLLGFANDQVASFTQYNFATSPVQPVAFYSFGLYFQDEVRINSKLKLTLALRADRNSGGVCQHNCASLPINQFSDIAHGADIPYNQTFQTGLKTIIPSNELIVFQPRAGFAWSPSNNTVLRGGAGLFSDLYPGTILSNIDTNFPQVNQWVVPGGSLAWDLNPASSSAFPTSGVALVQQCNSAFTTNYFNGGNLNTFLATPGLPAVCATTPTLNDVSRNLKNPKYVEWNLELQHTFHTGTMLSFNYVGNRGYDELYLNAYQNAFGFGSLPAAPADPRVGLVKFLNSGAVSNYNGLTVSVQQNSWHGLSGRFSYTFSHALDEVSNGGILPFSVITSVENQIDPNNLRANYASADYDARHQFTAGYIYQLPFKSSNRLLNTAIGGWQLSGTLFYRTGFPFSIIDGGTLGGLAGNNLSGTFNTILLQPQFAKRDFSDVSSCVINSCFGIAGTGSTAPYLFSPATNFTGATVGRNAFRGPGFLGGDMSLRKDFRFTERVGFQIGLNAYNWFNHANYGTPYPNTNAPFFGQSVFMQTPPTSPYGAFAAAATDMRMAQLTAKVTF
jgi:Carboxypeptidase regulatory-like domain/TonB-dependent Receptor Plug Domain